MLLNLRTFCPGLVQLPTYQAHLRSVSPSCQSRKCWWRHTGWCCGDWCRRCSAYAGVSVQTLCQPSWPLVEPEVPRLLPGPTYVEQLNQHHCLDQSTTSTTVNNDQCNLVKGGIIPRCIRQVAAWDWQLHLLARWFNPQIASSIGVSDPLYNRIPSYPI